MFLATVHLGPGERDRAFELPGTSGRPSSACGANRSLKRPFGRRRRRRCYDRGVNRQDLLAFAHRDWSLVAEAKAEFWQDCKRHRTPDDILAIGEQLRQHVRAVRPDWPSESERAADLAVHLRVTEALRAVSPRSR